MLPDIWNFVWALKSLLLNYPKYHLTWPNMSKKTKNDSPKLLNFSIEFAYSFGQTLGKSDSKKTLKMELKLFVYLHFQVPNNFCFSDYVTNTLILVQIWAGPFNTFVIFPGIERPHTHNLLVSVVFRIR